jgi:hypothetical protein
MTKFKLALTVLIVLAFFGSVALAQDTSKTDTPPAAEAEGTKNWEFALAPMYLWAVSIKGDLKVKGIGIDLDVPFSDVFDNLNGALTFHFEGVHKQNWGFFTDLNYIVLNPEDGAIDIEYTQVLYELAAFYRLIENGVVIDGFGGLRYSSMDVELDLPRGLPDVDQRKDWIDPYLGLRWKWPLGEKWALRLRTDFGGFGVGSRITWNGVGLVDFKPWKHVGFFGGYRALYQDYSTGSGKHRFSYDATMHGPALGLNITW